MEVSTVQLLLQDNPDSTRWAVSAAEAAWDDLDELKLRSKREFVAAALDTLPDERLDIVLEPKDQPGKAVAYASIALDDDMHVGVCATVQWNYCHPDYRGNHWAGIVMRELKRFAKAHGVQTVCYSHRTGEGTYEIKYRRL